MGEIGDVSEGGIQPVDGLRKVDPQKPSVETRRTAIKDKKQDDYTVDYIRVRGSDQVAIFDFPPAGQLLPDILAITAQTFPDINEDNIREKLFGCNGVDIVRAASGEPVAFHAYKFRELSEFDPPARVMSTSFAGVIPSYNGRRLTELSRMPVIEQENPDIIAGSTSIPAIYLSNERIAAERGLVMYPQDPGPPAEIVALGKKIYGITVEDPDPLKPHPITERLTRLRESDVVRGSHPFFDEVMKLAPNEQLYYLMLTPAFNQRVLGAEPKQDVTNE